MQLPENEAEAADREALGGALRFIEHRIRSKGETRDRLLRRGYDSEVCNRVVDYLECCGLLDDCEFARVFMGEMLRKGYGFNRVRRELLRKKLDRELVDEVLVEYPLDEELTRAVGLAGPLARKLQASDPATRSRRMVGYLTRRGYSGEVAREAFRIAGDVDTHMRPE